jgi:hypothetical protein
MRKPLLLLLFLLHHVDGISKNFARTPDHTFLINFDISTVICQHSSNTENLHLHDLSILCDGKLDCFDGTVNDENFPYCGIVMPFVYL